MYGGEQMEPNSCIVRAGSSSVIEGGSKHHVAEYIFAELNHSISEKTLVALKLVEPIEIDNITKKAANLFKSGEKIESDDIGTTAGWLWEDQGVGLVQMFNLKITNEKSCSEGNICAKFTASDLDKPSRCFDDDGTPLVVKDRLAGVSIGESICNITDLANNFVDISAYKQWIKNFTGTTQVINN